MTGEQLKLLTKMILEIGITESLAWQEILTLSSYNYVQDYKPFIQKVKIH